MPGEGSDERGPSGGPKKPPAQGESIAFTLLAGVAIGLAIGYGADRLAGTLPVFTIIGVFVGFGLALYAIFLETK